MSFFDLLSKFFPKRASDSNPSRSQPQNISSSSDGPPDTSLRDSVTGLYNRKHLIQRLEANMARCSRSKERMAVILWDIDGFVDFNNRFGQEQGDRFLSKVAETVRRSVRSYDEAFRAGSDEFCAILIPADDAVAKEVTERVRSAVSKGLFEGNTEYSNRQFSISVGLVFFPGDSAVPEALLHEAGQALYQNRLSRVPS